jgi:hypothetical protein
LKNKLIIFDQISSRLSSFLCFLWATDPGTKITSNLSFQLVVFANQPWPTRGPQSSLAALQKSLKFWRKIGKILRTSHHFNIQDYDFSKNFPWSRFGFAMASVNRERVEKSVDLTSFFHSSFFA